MGKVTKITKGNVHAAIKGKPQSKIAKFNSGDATGDYDYCVQLLINEKVQIRHMAIEATRLAANKRVA